MTNAHRVMTNAHGVMTNAHSVMTNAHSVMTNAHSIMTSLTYRLSLLRLVVLYLTVKSLACVYDLVGTDQLRQFWASIVESDVKLCCGSQC